MYYLNKLYKYKSTRHPMFQPRSSIMLLRFSYILGPPRSERYVISYRAATPLVAFFIVFISYILYRSYYCHVHPRCCYNCPPDSRGNDAAASAAPTDVHEDAKAVPSVRIGFTRTLSNSTGRSTKRTLPPIDKNKQLSDNNNKQSSETAVVENS